jgi:prephenate dehydrogenase
MEPERLLRLHLPHHANILVTHPLFGPQSASAGNTTGRELIVTASVGERADAVLAFCEQELGLTIHHTTAEAHDKAMAQVHALTFFVAHGLARAHVGKDVPFVTPSFAMIKDLVALDEKHTDALFATIQQGNPFAQEAREHLMRCFETIEIELQKEK